MQQFFRDWDAADRGHEVDPVFINQNEIGILKQLNADLRERMNDDLLRARFRRNVRILQDLASEISTRVTGRYPEVHWQDETGPVVEHRLDGVFEALNL